MAAASSRSLPNLASVELDEITWTNEVIKAQQWSCYSPSAACQWLQPSPTAMVQSGQLYHIDDNDYCCPYSSDHIPPTATDILAALEEPSLPSTPRSTPPSPPSSTVASRCYARGARCAPPPEDYHHSFVRSTNDSGLLMMDDCQDEAIWSSQGEKDQHKRQRPLLVGSFLLGLGLCCLFFVYPAMMIADMEAEEKAADRMSETKANHLLALICIMAAFASPLLALRFSDSNLMGLVSVTVFVAFVTCHIYKFVGLGWIYLAAGPFLAFIQWSHFSLLPGRAKAWLQASKALPHLVISLVLLSFFQSKDAQGSRLKTTILAFNIIVLALAGLCQLVHLYNTPPEAQSQSAQKQSKVLTMTNEKRSCCSAPRPLQHLLWFYLKDNHLHLLLPMAFFIGLFEAFMAKEFIMVSTRTLLGLERISVILGILGISKLISTCLTSQLHQIIPSYFLLLVLILFQLALLLLQWLWQPSGDDPLMFFALTFVWGTTSAAWDVLVLGPRGIGRYAVVAATAESTEAAADTAAAADTRAAAETAVAAPPPPDTRQQAVDQLADWKSAVALVSLHQFAGMAISFGLQVDARSLTAAFVVTIVPFWCYIRK